MNIVEMYSPMEILWANTGVRFTQMNSHMCAVYVAQLQVLYTKLGNTAGLTQIRKIYLSQKLGRKDVGSILWSLNYTSVMNVERGGSLFSLLKILTNLSTLVSFSVICFVDSCQKDHIKNICGLIKFDKRKI